MMWPSTLLTVSILRTTTLYIRAQTSIVVFDGSVYTVTHPLIHFDSDIITWSHVKVHKIAVIHRVRDIFK